MESHLTSWRVDLSGRSLGPRGLTQSISECRAASARMVASTRVCGDRGGLHARPDHPISSDLPAMKLDVAAADEPACAIAVRQGQSERVDPVTGLTAVHHVSGVGPTDSVDVRTAF